MRLFAMLALKKKKKVSCIFPALLCEGKVLSHRLQVSSFASCSIGINVIMELNRGEARVQGEVVIRLGYFLGALQSQEG